MDLFSSAKIDAHVHVFDPRNFPYEAGNFYLPSGGETGTPEHFMRLMDVYAVKHALLVGPNSGYGYDNGCLLAAIKKGGGRFKGIAVVHADISHAQLTELKQQGIVGVAMNPALLGTDYYGNSAALLEKLADLDLFAQVQVQKDQLPAMLPMLHSAPVRVLIDHCGRPDPALGINQPGFKALLRLADSGRVSVKLSGQYKITADSYPYADMFPFIEALLAAYGVDNCVWASDWPFLRTPERLDYGPLLQLVEHYLPAAADQHKLFWATPARLFGFPL